MLWPTHQLAMNLSQAYVYLAQQDPSAWTWELDRKCAEIIYMQGVLTFAVPTPIVRPSHEQWTW